MDFLTQIWNWLSNFLSSLNFTNSLKPPAGIPVTFLIVGLAIGGFLLWVLLKNALLAVLVLAGLYALWFLLAPLNSIILFSQSGLTLTALDAVLVATIAVGAYLLARSRGRK
jgi:hypothetical protein